MTLSYKSEKIHGAGLGLRPAFLREFAADPAKHADFFEVAPENWIHVQGKLRDPFEQAASHMPMVCHGLSLNLGGPKPLNLTLVGEIQQLLSLDNVAYYNEYLSYCGDEGHLYDLLLIPLTAATHALCGCGAPSHAPRAATHCSEYSGAQQLCCCAFAAFHLHLA